MTGLFKAVIKTAVALLVLGLALLIGTNLWVWQRTHDHIQTRPLQCDGTPIGIVFGTSSGLRGGGVNPWYRARLELAESLWKSGRVDHLLLSGDNHSRYYNEPIRMWRDLRRAGVANSAMTLDYAGFSTFDTLARARRVFGIDKATLISQRWHLPRAVYIARALGIDATGCATRARSMIDDRWMWLREIVARTAMLADLYLLDRRPKFLGPEIAVPGRGNNSVPVRQRVALPPPVAATLDNLRERLELDANEAKSGSEWRAWRTPPASAAGEGEDAQRFFWR